MSQKPVPARSPLSAATRIRTAFYRNPHLLMMTLIVIVAAGLSAWSSLPKIEDPRITQRFISVITEFPGASARLVESSVTEVLESELASISEIKTINSTSRTNVSVLSVELDGKVTRTNNRQIIARIRDRIKDAARRLPPQAKPPKVREEDNIAYAYTLITAVRWHGDQHTELSLLNRVAATLKDRIESVPGTEYVSLHGAPEEEIRVAVDAAELAELGLTVNNLAQVLRGSDSKQVAGRLLDAQHLTAIEVRGEFDSIERIGRIPVSSGSTDILLGDIANIQKTHYQPEQSITRLNGERVILVAARIKVQNQIRPWTDAVKAELAKLDADIGRNISLDIVFEQARYTEDRLQTLGTNLLAGMIAVLLVVWIFMGWRAGLIVATSLPLAAACVLFTLRLLDMQIQQMSMFGMIIAIGLLIDNAIVMTDEVRTRMHEGLSPTAAIEGALRHLFMPLLASTLTTILAFMPILLIEGNAGDFIGSISVSVILALIFSFILSMTIIPSICAWLENKFRHHEGRHWWQRGIQSSQHAQRFQHFLVSSLQHPWRAIGVAVALCLIGLVSVGNLPKVFFPSADRDMFELRVWSPQNSSVPATDTLIQQIDAHIRNKPAVRQTVWSVGDSIPAFYYNQIMNNSNQPYYAEVVITTDGPEDSARLIDELQQELDQQFPEVQIVAKAFAQGPPVEAPVEFRIFGPETETLRILGETLRAIIAAQPGTLHTQASVKPGQPKIWFNADENALSEVGLRLGEVANQLRNAYEGLEAGSVLEDIVELPVRVTFDASERASIEKLQAFPIALPNGGWAPASAFGDFTLAPESASITRRNGERVNIVHAYIASWVTPIDLSNKVKAALETGQWRLPEGYRWQVGGDAEESAQANASLAAHLPVLILLMVTCLVLAFRSFKLAGIIGLVAILSAGMGMLSLYISGYALGFNPLLGVTGLIGVAINGSIVVLAAIQANPQAKAGDHAAIVAETLSCTRHILSTTLTTIAGFIPLILFVGGQFWPPLAVVIAGGVGFSVILSLWFTPSLYALIYKPKHHATAAATTAMA
ncbi:MAG: efflux RND transporter permease subunit [Oleiphilaceae bacterium]|nr:efflux RND transporter permease subunit [Oleiphilaceae bacterium]